MQWLFHEASWGISKRVQQDLAGNRGRLEEIFWMKCLRKIRQLWRAEWCGDNGEWQSLLYGKLTIQHSESDQRGLQLDCSSGCWKGPLISPITWNYPVPGAKKLQPTPISFQPHMRELFCSHPSVHSHSTFLPSTYHPGRLTSGWTRLELFYMDTDTCRQGCRAPCPGRG